jgi:hypothetical protein
MPNLAGQALPYIEGLMNRGEGLIRKGLQGVDSLAERSGAGIINYGFSALRNPFVRRTSLGAIGGGIAGAIYGGASDDGSVIRSGIVGAGIGAAGARYGGAFIKGSFAGHGFDPLRGGIRTMASGRSDFRMAMRQGKSAASLIGNTMTSGIGKIQGLMMRRVFR